MNGIQKRLLKIVAVLIGAIIAFPPYVMVIKGRTLYRGFAFILDFPAKVSMNFSMFIAEIGAVLLIGAILFFVAKDNNRKGFFIVKDDRK